MQQQNWLLADLCLRQAAEVLPASALLDRVIEDAASRGATWIEAYPHTKPEEGDAGHFRGPRSMYEARGFEPVEKQERFTVMRRRV